jgi:hypothetical protein
MKNEDNMLGSAQSIEQSAKAKKYVFNPMEGEVRKGVRMEESQVLYFYDKMNKSGNLVNPKEYPSNPCVNSKSVWKELPILDAESAFKGASVESQLLFKQMGKVLYDKYKTTLQRNSLENIAFAKLVISSALNLGFNDMIISVDSDTKAASGLKITAMRGVLHRLHAMGIIIFLRGVGTRNPYVKSIPMGFVLHPCIQKSINEYMGLIHSGKMDLEGLQYIDVKVRDIN